MFDTWDCAFSALSIPCSYIRWEEIPIKTDTITVFVDACFVGPPVPEAVPICRLSSGCHRQLFFLFRFTSFPLTVSCTVFILLLLSLSLVHRRCLIINIAHSFLASLRRSPDNCRKPNSFSLADGSFLHFRKKLRQSPAQTIPCTLPSIF